VTVEQYALDYQVPSFPGHTLLATGIKIAHFSSAQEIAGTEMLFQPGPYQRQVWDYHRWRVSPADLVGDLLARDLRASGLFSLVLSHHDPSTVRFKIEGVLEHFQMSKSPRGSAAALQIDLTLLDIRERELPHRIIFQRGYHDEVSLAQPGPLELAQGLSQAMAQLSAKVIADLYLAIAQRLQESPW
jgi:ABC-type uncharacterized transport system auxiliary subunit